MANILEGRPDDAMSETGSMIKPPSPPAPVSTARVAPRGARSYERTTESSRATADMTRAARAERLEHEANEATLRHGGPGARGDGFQDEVAALQRWAAQLEDDLLATRPMPVHGGVDDSARKDAAAALGAMQAESTDPSPEPSEMFESELAGDDGYDERTDLAPPATRARPPPGALFPSDEESSEGMDGSWPEHPDDDGGAMGYPGVASTEQLAPFLEQHLEGEHGVDDFARAEEDMASRQQQRQQRASEEESLGSGEPRSLPSLMAALRGRLADELYRVGETLFASVEADFSEVALKRPPARITEAELLRFRRRLHTSAHGTLRWLLMIYLRAYMSMGRMLRLKQNAELAAGGAALAANAMSIAADSEVMRELLLGLLDEVRELWTRRRRVEGKPPSGYVIKPPGHDLSKLGEHRQCTRKSCEVCAAKAAKARMREAELGFLHEGAGPKEFWRVVAPNRKPGGLRLSVSMLGAGLKAQGEAALTKARVEPRLDQIEMQLWRIALLVRCHDRAKGLRLRRHEPQRKLLDLRLCVPRLFLLLSCPLLLRVFFSRRPGTRAGTSCSSCISDAF